MSRQTTTKFASLHRRIYTLVTRRKTLVEAHGERQRLADFARTTTAVADDDTVRWESQCKFAFRTLKLTLFQGRQRYERHGEPKLKCRRVSESQLASAATDENPSHHKLRADVDQTIVVPEREPAVDQVSQAKRSPKRSRAYRNYIHGDELLPTPLSSLDSEYASDGILRTKTLRRTKKTTVNLFYRTLLPVEIHFLKRDQSQSLNPRRLMTPLKPSFLKTPSSVQLTTRSATTSGAKYIPDVELTMERNSVRTSSKTCPTFEAARQASSTSRNAIITSRQRPLRPESHASFRALYSSYAQFQSRI